MAENKKSFIAYSDWKDTFDALPDDKAGVLIKHIFAYVNDENPTTEDFLINAVFANIKNTLKRDLQKWDNQYDQRVEAGKKSAEVRKRNATLVNDRSISSTVSDSVSVTDSDIIEKIKPKKKPIKKVFISPTKIEFMQYAKSQLLDDIYQKSKKKLEWKWNAWNTDEWKDGNGKQISNWKSKLLHNLNYITQ